MKKMFTLAITFLLVLAFLGCNDDSDDNSSSTPAGLAQADGSSPQSNCVLNGEINKITDSLNDVKFLGEVKNIGNKTANFIQAHFNFYNSNGTLIKTSSTFILGSCLTLAHFGIEIDSCLEPNEIGYFELNTTLKENDFNTYNYSFSFDSYDTQKPLANLVILNSSKQNNNNSIEILGNVKNIGIKGLTFGDVHSIIKNSSGKLIDLSFSYIKGENIQISNRGAHTDTALSSLSEGTFSINTLIGYDPNILYEIKTSWSDSTIENGVATALSSFISNNKIVNKLRDSNYRDNKIKTINEFIKRNYN